METVVNISWLIISAIFLCFTIIFFRKRKKDKRYEFCIIAFIILLSSNPFYGTTPSFLMVKSIFTALCLFYLIKLFFSLHRKIECIKMKEG